MFLTLLPAPPDSKSYLHLCISNESKFEYDSEKNAPKLHFLLAAFIVYIIFNESKGLHYNQPLIA